MANAIMQWAEARRIALPNNVADHDERRLGAAHIVRRDIDLDRTRPDAGMAFRDAHVRLLARRRCRRHDRAVAAAWRIVADQAGIVA
jgi:hypothetical protein